MKVKTTLILILLLASTGAMAQVANIRVNGQASVAGGTMTIGDIAAVECSDSSLASSLKAVRLGVSPMPGSWRELEKEVILNQLQRSGYSLKDVKLLSPKFIKVYRKSQTISQPVLESRIRDFIAANAPWTSAEMDVTEVSQVRDLMIPEGDLFIDVRLRGTGSYLGLTPFIADIHVDGKSVKQIVIQARIRVFRQAIVAINAIPNGQMISANDLELRRIDISTAKGKSFSKLQDLSQMAAKTYIQAGQVITTSHVIPPILVKRGNVVSLEATSRGFQIRTTGIAQQDGRRGELIRVKNTSSKKIIDAKVTGSGRVEVLF